MEKILSSVTKEKNIYTDRGPLRVERTPKSIYIWYKKKYLDFTSFYSQIQHPTGPGFFTCRCVVNDSLVTTTSETTRLVERIRYLRPVR